jgi:hypothetical protein
MVGTRENLIGVKHPTVQGIVTKEEFLTKFREPDRAMKEKGAGNC